MLFPLTAVLFPFLFVRPTYPQLLVCALHFLKLLTYIRHTITLVLPLMPFLTPYIMWTEDNIILIKKMSSTHPSLMFHG